MKTKIMQLLETTMVDDGDQLLFINKEEIPELAESIVKLFAIPVVSGSALADLNHIVVNAAMNISTTAIEDTAIQTECRKIIDTVRGFTKHYR